MMLRLVVSTNLIDLAWGRLDLGNNVEEGVWVHVCSRGVSINFTTFSSTAT
jgi:hypothetical protein